MNYPHHRLSSFLFMPQAESCFLESIWRKELMESSMTISSGYSASGNTKDKRQLEKSWQGRLDSVELLLQQVEGSGHGFCFFFFFNETWCFCSKCIPKENKKIFLLVQKASRWSFWLHNTRNQFASNLYPKSIWFIWVWINPCIWFFFFKKKNQVFL